jgi:hypothetical protein
MIGTEIAGNRILEKLGEGGMAKTGTHMGGGTRDDHADTPPIRQNFNFIPQGFSRVRAASMLEPASRGR